MRRLPLMLLSAFSVGCVSARECRARGELQYSLGRLAASLDSLKASLENRYPTTLSPLERMDLHQEPSVDGFRRRDVAHP